MRTALRPLILSLVVSIGIFLPMSASAEHSCSVQPFSQSITQGGQALYTVALHTSSSTNPFEVRTGNLPNGIQRGFVSRLSGSTTPGSVQVVFTTDERSQTGPMTIAVFYDESDGSALTESTCLLTLSVLKKAPPTAASSSLSSNVAVQPQASSPHPAPAQEKINVDNTTPMVSTLAGGLSAYTKTHTVTDSSNQTLGMESATSAASTTPDFIRKVSYGEHGDLITALQDYLRGLGYFPQSQESTGYFGPITREAVRSYQQANNLEPVGYLGPKTRALLNNAVNR